MSIAGFNFFNDIPLETFHYASSYLSVKDLGRLCQAHGNIRLRAVPLVLKRLIQEFRTSHEKLNHKIAEEKKVLRRFAENTKVLNELLDEVHTSHPKIETIYNQFKICHPTAPLSREEILEVRALEHLIEENSEALMDLYNFKRRNFKPD